MFVECPKCKAKQVPSRVTITRNGENEITQYEAACSCGEGFFGFLISERPSQILASTGT